MNDRRREDFAKALFGLDNQNPREKRPPRCEPRVQPVNGIVQPPVMPPPNRKGRVTNFLLKLRTAVNALSRNPSSLHFRKPVDAVKLNIRDYYEKIASPMDLNTIKKRFEHTYYWGGADVLEDILLIFENCRTYNSPDSTVFKAAVTLCECFWLRMAKMQKELHNECRVEVRTRRPRKASISKTSPLPKTPRQENAVIPKKTNVEIKHLNQPKADDPLPSLEAVPNQHPNRHHCKQFTPVTPARRGRGRPPGPRSLTRADADRNAVISQEFPALQRPPNLLKNYGTQVEIDPFPVEPVLDQLSIKAILMPLNLRIERTYSQTLIKALRCGADSWPFNKSSIWMHFGCNRYYDFHYEPLDWDILEKMLAGEQFKGWDWLLIKLQRMLKNAMSRSTVCPSVRIATQRTFEKFREMMTDYEERMAHVKATAYEAVRLKLDAMTPSQRAVVETEHHEEDDSLRIITKILGKTQLMHYLRENRLLKLNTLLNISNRSGTLSRHATPSNSQDLEASGLATMAKRARLSDDPLPSLEAVPNQHPNRHHCKQFTPVTPARRGRGRPPGPRSLTRADADRNAVISQEFPALQRPPNLLKNYGTQVEIDPFPVEPVLDQLSIKAILMPLNLRIERTYSQTLIKALRCGADSWPFNKSSIWMHFGCNRYYDFPYEPLDWDILEKMLAGEQFKGWDWLLIKLQRMLKNAMSRSTVCPSVRIATQRTFEKFREMMTDYEERMAHVKATAYEAVRLKLDAMTPSQRAVVETEHHEEDDSLRIITKILGKTQLMHYLRENRLLKLNTLLNISNRSGTLSRHATPSNSQDLEASGLATMAKRARLSDDPLPSLEAVPNQHPNRHHCKQFTPVTPARRGRGRPPGPRSLTRADADRNAVISQEFPALQRPPNLLKNYGTQVEIDPFPVEPVLDQLSIKAILMPLNLRIERTYSQTLIKALRCGADSWPFNKSSIWMHFGCNRYYDFPYEPLDWDILEKMLAGEQFKGWDWLLIKLQRMLKNAMSRSTVCPSVRIATQRTFEKFREMMTDYEERMAHVKATAYEAVRLKLDAMTPSQRAVVETEHYEEDYSLRIITKILGKTQLMHYLQENRLLKLNTPLNISNRSGTLSRHATPSNSQDLEASGLATMAKRARLSDDPLPSLEAVPNQHPNRHHCKQFTPVTPARRGRGRPPGPRSLTRADADRNAVISQEFPALQRPPNLLKNYGTQVEIDPFPVEPVLDQLSIKAILMPLNLRIERTYSQTLIKALRCGADSWPFNKSSIWMHFGCNRYYDFHYEPLDWDILEKMLAGEQFKGWDWLLIKLQRMLKNAMSRSTVCPSVRIATQRTFEKFREMMTDYEERMAHVKATAYEAVRLKLDAMTPSQRAVVETEHYEEDYSLRIITKILGKTQLMHYLQENRLLKLNTPLNISNRSGTLSRHATPSNSQDLEASGLATMAKMARLSDDEEE